MNKTDEIDKALTEELAAGFEHEWNSVIDALMESTAVVVREYVQSKAISPIEAAVKRIEALEATVAEQARTIAGLKGNTP
jgi:hypothetical protein